jgi:hypothetical protein
MPAQAMPWADLWLARSGRSRKNATVMPTPQVGPSGVDDVLVGCQLSVVSCWKGKRETCSHSDGDFFGARVASEPKTGIRSLYVEFFRSYGAVFGLFSPGFHSN